MIDRGAPLQPDQFHGIVPALITPLDADGEVDRESIDNLVEFQLAARVHALFVLGSTGEGPLLTIEQRLAVVRATVDAAKGRAPVLAGIMDSSPRQSLAFGQAAADAGVNAVVAASPFYFLQSSSELGDYYRHLHRQLSVPIVAYDVPSAVKAKLTPKLLRGLAESGVLLGLKDSSGDFSMFRDLLIQLENVPEFRAMTGSEFMVDTTVLLGGAGAVLGLANVVPDLYVRVYAEARAGRWAESAASQRQAIALFPMILAAGSGGSYTASAIGSFKVALREIGVIRSATLAWPFKPFTADEEETVRAALQGRLPVGVW